MKMLVIAALALAASNAHAKQDPRFTYDNAEAAYNSAAVPTVADVTATQWILVGKASAPSKTHWADGYWTDGRQPGQVGSYQEYLTISNAPDAFGTPTLTARETYYGAETGLLYKTYDYTYTSDADAINITESRDYPKALQACRLVSSTGMLLCKITFNNPCHERRERLDAGQAAMYLGYLPTAAPVAQ